MFKMNPYLMGATGIQLEAQQRVITKPFHQRPMGAGVTALLSADHRIVLAIGRMASNRPNDGAAVAIGHAMDQGEILP